MSNYQCLDSHWCVVLGKSNPATKYAEIKFMIWLVRVVPKP